MIHQFDPIIYPCRLWVAIHPAFEEVKEMFYGLNSEMERVEITESGYLPDHFVVARTYTVSDKKTGWIGVLMCIWKPKQFNTKLLCHESAHCADFICENFGIETGKFDSGEPYAYLIGWIADCIEKVKLNKLSPSGTR